MKYLLFLPLIALFSFTSGCKKDESPTSVSNPEMVATVDGTQWSASNVSVQSISTLRQITGVSNSSGSAILLSLYSVGKTGDYGLSDSDLNGAVLTMGSTTYSSTSGKLTVTEISGTQIKGTFNCTVKADGSGLTKTITNGRFTANF